MARKKKTVRRTKVGTRKRAASSRTGTMSTKRRTRKKAAAASTAKKSTTKSTTKSRRTTRAASPAGMSLSELQAEIASRVADLHARRDVLLGEIAEIDAALANAGASAGAAPAAAPGRRGRPAKNGTRSGTRKTSTRKKKAGGTDRRTKGVGGKNLAESLYEVLKGKEMKVAELVDAVKAAGYDSKSPNFRVMVSGALGKHRGTMFKNVRRGVYTTVG